MHTFSRICTHNIHRWSQLAATWWPEDRKKGCISASILLSLMHLSSPAHATPATPTRICTTSLHHRHPPIPAIRPPKWSERTRQRDRRADGGSALRQEQVGQLAGPLKIAPAKNAWEGEGGGGYVLICIGMGSHPSIHPSRQAGRHQATGAGRHDTHTHEGM
mmetsp:Transcript_44107/g.124838  ORF Transcript_44107/g.124838 Transcript_44107/m.124838 type:complete len:162 (+) Transcript_44107:359-844(+)